jgi:hypothetical protein
MKHVRRHNELPSCTTADAFSSRYARNSSVHCSTCRREEDDKLLPGQCRVVGEDVAPNKRVLSSSTHSLLDGGRLQHLAADRHEHRQEHQTEACGRRGDGTAWRGAWRDISCCHRMHSLSGLRSAIDIVVASIGVEVVLVKESLAHRSPRWLP